MKKNTTKKSAKKSFELLGEKSFELIKDSNALLDGAKYRVTFLVGQSFRGTYYKNGENIVLPEKDAKAYSKRTGLRIERME